jgi:hypothetical protein
MKMPHGLWVVVLATLITTAGAAPPAELDYQGKVLINDLPYTGSGYFKFALANAAGTTNFWAQDGTASGEPAGHVTNSVYNGVFSTVLGAAPMAALPPAVFALNTSLYLRVWFGSTNTSFAEMLPAQKVVSVAYALNAGLLGGASSSEIQSNAVSTATNNITLAGDVTGPPHANSIAPGVIVDGDVNASAAITGTKIQQGTTAARGTVQLATGATGLLVIAQGHPWLNAYGLVNTLTAAAPNSALSIVGAGSVSIGVTQPNILTITGTPDLPPADLVWVSALQGNDLTADGSAAKPFQTAQAGYAHAAAVYGALSRPAAIVLAAGVYAGGLNMAAGNVHVFGVGRAELAFLNVQSFAPAYLNSKQRVENVVVTGPTFVSSLGTSVKFHNVKMLNGLQIWGNQVEVQDCYILNRGEGPHSSSLEVGDGVNAVTDIGIYHSGIEYTVGGGFAAQVQAKVQNFEMLWNEIINTGGGPAIMDLEPGPIDPKHLYAHNWIKGPSPSGGVRAVQDPMAGQNGATIAFYNNTVFGNVGTGAHSQYYGNNYVYGRITAAAGTGWTQAGSVLLPANTSNDTEHQPENIPSLPNTYRD